MTRAQLYVFLTSLLFGYQMDETLFETLLDTAQAEIENERPWMILRQEDATLTVGAGNTFTTAFSIAPTNSDFRKWDGRTPIVLVDSSNNPLPFEEIPASKKYTHKSAQNVFYCDYTQNKFYLCGTITQSYTIHQFYIKKSPLVSAASGNTWVFPSEFHKLLPLKIAMNWKGIDYDMINNMNLQSLNAQYEALHDQLTRWDSDLQAHAQQGYDPFGDGGGWTATSSGGRIG